MSNLDAILEIAIGLVLTWLIISVATVEVQDIFSNIFNRRAKFLEQSILDMFRGEQGFVDQFYEHPIIKALYKKNIFGKPRKPDYIPNDAFAEVALEMFVNLGTENDKTTQAAASLDALAQNEELSYFINRLLPDKSIEQAAQKARDFHEKAVEFKTNAENWFDSSMTKASYWYKDQAKTIAFVIGLILAATFNVDSIQITEQLWREPTLRQTLVAQAQVANQDTGPQSVAQLEEYYQDLDLPVGWSNGAKPIDLRSWAIKIAGLIITGLAAMQGAPFWFDMLKKLINLKGGSSSDSNGGGSAASPPVQPPAEPEPVG